ncbi:MULTISPECIES: hypothetical protein [Salinimicrobium]|uniref:Uncharacterized protein n=1 Tax=Salinimicrobium oceani TaxID=2722702 RepID=A0ABX1CWR9_9FLAO|nr:hypothetical protein [Salinimicrobium oceani]NJW52730.1 hypothetical protein [Salinimicrobium oceani]
MGNYECNAITVVNSMFLKGDAFSIAVARAVVPSPPKGELNRPQQSP